ncbi:MAG: phosphotyrosine protein phosphatase [Candidatus Choladocola sp.]|nr:phosphotyrosine protein phosphatase [Candidatus Choladocola sp.]
MKRYDRLIFVSNSDTATGPMAEAILQSKFLLEDLSITSKGVVVLFPEPINPKAEAVLVSNGLTMKDHMSDPLVKEDFDERTLIMFLNESLKQKILKEFEPEHTENVHVLNEYVGSDSDLINPYGGSLADYGQCYTELEALVSKLVIQLNEEELLC